MAAAKPSPEEAESINRHVVALLREELHKLEYGYDREARRNPPEKAIGKAILPRAVRERLKYLAEQKESMEADLKNLTSERNVLKDRKTQLEIGEYLDMYDAYSELIRKKIFKVNELRKNNSAMIQLITDLSTEVNRRNAILREETDKYATQNGSLESRVNRSQLCLNRLTSDNKELIRQMNDSLTLRKALHENYMRQNKVYTNLKNKIAKTARMGCNIFIALKFGRQKMETKMIQHNQMYDQYQVTIQDMYDMVAMNLSTREYFDKLRISRDEMDTSGQAVKKLTPQEKDLKTAESTAKHLRKYEARLLKSTKCKDLQEVSEMYETVDEENLELVTTILDLDDEATRLSKENHELVKSIDDYYETLPGVQPNVLSYENELKATTNILVSTVEDVEQHSKMAELAQHCLDLILPALQDTFEVMAGNSDPLAVFLGAKKGFSPLSVEVCMNLTEHRLADLLYEKQYYRTWKQRIEEGEDADTKIPELRFGHPPSAGGIISPNVHVARQGEDIQDEVQETLRLENLQPILEIDAQQEAKEKVWNLNIKKKEAEKWALFKQRESVKELAKPKKLSDLATKHNSKEIIPNPLSRKSSAISSKSSVSGKSK